MKELTRNFYRDRSLAVHGRPGCFIAARIAGAALILAALTIALGAPAFAQQMQPSGVATDEGAISIGRARPAIEFTGAFAGSSGMPHPYHFEARHWGPATPHKNLMARIARLFHPDSLKRREELAKLEACNAARAGYVERQQIPSEQFVTMYGCGQRYYEYNGENLVTSVGETLFSDLMAKVSSPPAQCNYVALTNTGITPAVGDTTLSGEISTNGLSRAQATYADASAGIGAPPSTGAISQAGTAGSTTVDYWVFACTFQGCSAAGTGAQTTTSNATLSATNYNTFSFTGKLGAAFYRVIRTHNNTTPSGSLAGGSTITTADGEISAGYISCATSGGLVAGTAPTCTVADQSNTVSAFTVPASDQTFFGKYTLTKTFTATGAQSAQAFGIFNASSSGTMCLEGTFPSASLQANDTLAFAESVYH